MHGCKENLLGIAAQPINCLKFAPIKMLMDVLQLMELSTRLDSPLLMRMDVILGKIYA